VLAIQEACIELTKKKGMSLSKLHTQSVTLAISALESIGLRRYANNVSSSDEVVTNKQDYFKLYPHSIGHYLGMDTHDTPLMPSHATLQPGSIITIEPGLYFPDSPDIPEWYNPK
jgi:Xaa-Pro aminopeptidase